jgi:hypothetical protein
VACIPENAAAQSPEPLQGSSTRVPSQDDELAVPRPVFELHSGFWLNLHHFLYEQARLRDQESTSRGKVSGPVQDSGAAESRGADSRPWQAAVNYYAKNLARRDLLIDQGMVLTNNRLADLETCADLSGRASPTCASGLPPALVARP